MKRIVLMVLAMVMISSVAFGAVLNLRATWTANSESDMAGYNLYRTDGTRLKLNPTLILIPLVQYDFSITVPDNFTGTMTLDIITANKVYDLVPPARPAGFIINFR